MSEKASGVFVAAVLRGRCAREAVARSSSADGCAIGCSRPPPTRRPATRPDPKTSTWRCSEFPPRNCLPCSSRSGRSSRSARVFPSTRSAPSTSDSPGANQRRAAAIKDSSSKGIRRCRSQDAARRRDFTVNAIAWDPLTEEFEDPFGGCDRSRQENSEGRRSRARSPTTVCGCCGLSSSPRASR